MHLVRYADEPDDALDEETRNLARYLKVAKDVVNFNGEITEEALKEATDLIEEFDLNLEAFNNAVEKIQTAA